MPLSEARTRSDDPLISLVVPVLEGRADVARQAVKEGLDEIFKESQKKADKSSDKPLRDFDLD